MTDTDKLLKAILAELVLIGDRLGVERKPKAKAWGALPVQSVTRDVHGVVNKGAADVPSGIDKDMQDITRAQTVKTNTQHVEPVEKIEDRPANVLTELQKKAFENWR
jgi:hypothetical protein